ncbi:MAG: hypothetical protein EOO38_18365, partial [Cytophagaceae bacterium]
MRTYSSHARARARAHTTHPLHLPRFFQGPWRALPRAWAPTFLTKTQHEPESQIIRSARVNIRAERSGASDICFCFRAASPRRALCRDGCWYGVDIEHEGICDTLERGVWEPSSSKINSFASATEAACLVLSVDEGLKTSLAKTGPSIWPAIVNFYSITSANDEPARDPVDWRLQASNDGVNWNDVDIRTGQQFSQRFFAKQYSVASATTAYRFYRLNVTRNNGEPILQLAELSLNGKYVFATNADTTQANAAKITASSEYSAAGEGRVQAFDNNKATKWLTFNSTGWLAYQFDKPTSIGAYTIASANDFANRDPRSWKLQASNNGVNWSDIDTRTNQTFASRFSTNTYPITNSSSYTHYRLNVTANSGANILQIAEVELIANPQTSSSSSSVSSSISSSSKSSSSKSSVSSSV